MKKTIILMMLGAAALTACQRMEEAPRQEEGPMTWTLTVRADKEATKALDLVEDKTLNTYWKAGEKVNVYLADQYVGFLEVTPDEGEKPTTATLSGPLSLSSLIDVGDELNLLFPRRTDYGWTYEGQNGLLTGTGSIEECFDYALATVTVEEKDAAHGTFKTTGASFRNQQSIYRFGFNYGGNPLPVKTMILSSAEGQLATSCNIATREAVTGPLTVVRPTANTDLTYVAIRNGNSTQDDTFNFTIYDDNGVTYEGSKVIPAAALTRGFVGAKDITTTRLDAELSTSETTTVL